MSGGGNSISIPHGDLFSLPLFGSVINWLHVPPPFLRVVAAD